MVDSSTDFLLGRTRSSVKDQVPVAGYQLRASPLKRRGHIQWLRRGTTKLAARVFLVLSEQIGLQFHVSRLVHTVYITERSRDTEVGADRAQCLVNVIYILRLGVQGGIVDTGIVDAVFFTASNADFHLEPETKRGHALEVFDAGLYVLFLGLLGEIKHVRGEQGLLVRFVVFLVCCKHAIEPGEKLLGTVIAVQHDWAIGTD